MSLRQAEIQGVPVCARGGAAVANQLRRDYPKLNIVYGESFADTYQKLGDGECFTLATRASDWQKYQRNEEVNDQCQLQWIGRAENINAGGPAAKIDIGTNCTSLVLHVIDIHIHEMIISGFIEKAWGDYIESISTKRCGSGDAPGSSDEVSSEKSSLNPIDVGGIFLVHGVMVVLAILVALVERKSWDKTKRKQQGGLHQQNNEEVMVRPKMPHFRDTMSDNMDIEHDTRDDKHPAMMMNSDDDSSAAAPTNRVPAISEMLEETRDGLRRKSGGMTAPPRSAGDDDPGEQILQRSIEALIALEKYYRCQKEQEEFSEKY